MSVSSAQFSPLLFLVKLLLLADAVLVPPASAPCSFKAEGQHEHMRLPQLDLGGLSTSKGVTVPVSLIFTPMSHPSASHHAGARCRAPVRDPLMPSEALRLRF